MKNAGILRRAGYSLAGLQIALMQERSLRSHVVLSLSLFGAMAALEVGRSWWAVMLLAVAVGWGFELMNAAVERLCDRLHPDRHPDIGAVKDLASGAAFVVNVTTGLLALAMFSERL
ncbi:diacylglycerol kinase [Qipengyuania soli]|uniref:Diacylglycerol kinase n=1 Tax=Qipengyuania soli TaxID=2782568 RepID=A0A7S8F532_9SPHN|nr:diacylglycerol kinase [Qipengyuania soli]QPC99374.1 diacylglycerol kinase [Qipengyuania soli]